jgi:hypothetical protein
VVANVINETTRAERWIRTILLSDPTIAGIVGARVYAEVAPSGATEPFVVMQFLGSPDAIYGNDNTIIWQKLAYIVKAITKGNSSSSLQTLVDRINTVLHAQRGGTADAAIDYCIRRKPFKMVDPQGHDLYQHLGSEFELAVRAASV